MRNMEPIDIDEHGRLVFEEGVEPYVIRTSDRERFKKCRREWNWSSPLGRNLEPVILNKNLAFGIAVHKGLEAFYHPSTYYLPVLERAQLAASSFVVENTRQRHEEQATLREEMYDERIEEYQEREELGKGMMLFYGNWVEQTGEDYDIEPIAVELMFQVQLMDEEGKPLVINGRPVVYQVRVDLAYRRRSTGGIVIMDHKTTSSMDDDSFLDVDTQISSYIVAAKAWFKTETVERADYNELLKSVPHKPKVLKNGSLSQDRRQRTTYELYLETIEEQGLDPDPYGAMLAFLRERPADYVRRTPIVRSRRELAYQHRLMVAEVRDMLSNPFIYPSPGKMNCKGCGFRPPCVVANEVGDVDFFLNDPSQYRARQSELDLQTS